MRTFLKTQRQRNNSQKGFTLVEVLVALTLFVIVMTVSISSLMVVNNAARKAQAMRILLDNITFAMDSMTRTIRTADAVSCGATSTPNNCPIDAIPKIKGTSLYVDSTLGEGGYITYGLNSSGAIVKTVVPKAGTSGSSTSLVTTLEMTSPEIRITKLDFYVDGALPDDYKQPIVHIFISGEARASRDQVTPFSFQTVVTPRALGL